MPSLVQRFGRAARDPKIQGFGILYAPPANKAYPTDNNVREYLANQKGCLWTTIDKLFGNDARTCNNNCSGCFKVDLRDKRDKRDKRTTGCPDTKSSAWRRWPKRSKEEKAMALNVLLAWRKQEFKKLASLKRYSYGGEEWVLPNQVAKQLSQKFSGVRTATAVEDIASSCNWTPLTGKSLFGDVAKVLDKLNNEIDARCESDSQTTAITALDQSEDSSDSDEEGSDGDGNLLGS